MQQRRFAVRLSAATLCALFFLGFLMVQRPAAQSNTGKQLTAAADHPDRAETDQRTDNGSSKDRPNRASKKRANERSKRKGKQVTAAAKAPDATTTTAPAPSTAPSTSKAPATNGAAQAGAPSTPSGDPAAAPAPPPAPAPQGTATCADRGSAGTRSALLGQIDGFAAVAGTTGAGHNGATYVVTNTNDSGPGSLREGMQAGGRWVVFDPQAFPAGAERVIRVQSPIMVAADTTLDGRCANVRLEGAGADVILTIGEFGRRATSNVVVSNVKIGPIPGNGGAQSGDGIRIVWGSDRFFVSHVEIFKANDEAIEISRGDQGRMRGTIANSLVRDTRKAILVGDGTKNNEKQGGWATGAHRIQVTFHHNWFLRNQIRNPLVVDSSVHLYNNLIDTYGLAHTPDDGAGIELGGNAWVWAQANVVNQPSPSGDYCGIDVVNYGSLGVTGQSHLSSNDNAFRGIARECAWSGPAPAVPSAPPYAANIEAIGDGGGLVSRLTSQNAATPGRAGWVAMQ